MPRVRHMPGWGRMTFWLMSAIVLGLWLSGLLMHLLPATELADMTAAQALLRRISTMAHGVLSWLFCVMCGRGVWPHVRMMWHRQAQTPQWLQGLSALALLLFLGLGGLLLLYASPDVHELLAPWHFWAGAAVPLVLLAHTLGRFVRNT